MMDPNQFAQQGLGVLQQGLGVLSQGIASAAQNPQNAGQGFTQGAQAQLPALVGAVNQAVQTDLPQVSQAVQQQTNQLAYGAGHAAGQGFTSGVTESLSAGEIAAYGVGAIVVLGAIELAIHHLSKPRYDDETPTLRTGEAYATSGKPYDKAANERLSCAFAKVSRPAAKQLGIGLKHTKVHPWTPTDKRLEAWRFAVANRPDSDFARYDRANRLYPGDLVDHAELGHGVVLMAGPRETFLGGAPGTAEVLFERGIEPALQHDWPDEAGRMRASWIKRHGHKMTADPEAPHKVWRALNDE